jgi:hypothetical protein
LSCLKTAAICAVTGGILTVDSFQDSPCPASAGHLLFGTPILLHHPRACGKVIFAFGQLVVTGGNVSGIVYRVWL